MFNNFSISKIHKKTSFISRVLLKCSWKFEIKQHFTYIKNFNREKYYKVCHKIDFEGKQAARLQIPPFLTLSYHVTHIQLYVI